MFHCGKHLILDVWTPLHSPKLGDMEEIAQVMKASAKYAGATILGDNWHHFGEGYGVTGVVMLSESHMSIHTWPEHGYAAIDVFMCGDCKPQDTVSTLLNYFQPINFLTTEITRGLVFKSSREEYAFNRDF